MLTDTLDGALVDAVLAKARLSPRQRANHCFHAPADRLQRMVNCALKGSYFAPHRHEQSGKLEIFTILRGRVLIAAFDDDGHIEDKVVLEAGRGPWQATIPPFTWHTLAVLSADAALFEVIDGHYDPLTHKVFAPWAPPESDGARGQAYLESLIHRCGLDAGL